MLIPVVDPCCCCCCCSRSLSTAIEYWLDAPDLRFLDVLATATASTTIVLLTARKPRRHESFTCGSRTIVSHSLVLMKRHETRILHRCGHPKVPNGLRLLLELFFLGGRGCECSGFKGGSDGLLFAVHFIFPGKLLHIGRPVPHLAALIECGQLEFVVFDAVKRHGSKRDGLLSGNWRRHGDIMKIFLFLLGWFRFVTQK